MEIPVPDWPSLHLCRSHSGAGAVPPQRGSFGAGFILKRSFSGAREEGEGCRAGSGEAGAVTWVLRLMENRPHSEFRAESRSRAWPALLQLRFQRGPGASPDGNSQPHAASLSCCGWMWGRWVLGDPSITVPALLLLPPSTLRARQDSHNPLKTERTQNAAGGSSSSSPVGLLCSRPSRGCGSREGEKCPDGLS